MKKLTAILLSALLLLNVLGYYGLYLGMRYRHQQSLLSLIDSNGISEQQTITIKIPLAVPYALEQQEFRRVDGEIEYKGNFFRLVKQRLTQDTLYVVCVRDLKSSRMYKALADHVAGFMAVASQGNSFSQQKIPFLKDYFASPFLPGGPLADEPLLVVHTPRLTQLIDSYTPSILLPPEC